MKKQLFSLALLLIFALTLPGLASALDEVKAEKIPPGYHKVRSIKVTYTERARHTPPPHDKFWPDKEEKYMIIDINWELSECFFVTTSFFPPDSTKKVIREDGDWAMKYDQKTSTLTIRGPKSHIDEVLKKLEKRSK